MSDDEGYGRGGYDQGGQYDRDDLSHATPEEIAIYNADVDVFNLAGEEREVASRLDEIMNQLSQLSLSPEAEQQLKQLARMTTAEHDAVVERLKQAILTQSMLELFKAQRERRENQILREQEEVRARARTVAQRRQANQNNFNIW